MYDKEKTLFEGFVKGHLSRRELLQVTGKLGLSAGTAGIILAAAQTKAMAADFDWLKFKGSRINLLLNKHPYTDALIANMQSFKDLTGMDVSWDVFPEDVYFDKVTEILASGSSAYDVFMTGPYMTWSYGPAGWIVDLNEFIRDPVKTSPAFNWEDILPNLRASTAWNGTPGSPLGSPDAKQWCMPWGYELNNITYNKKMFDSLGLQPPKNLAEMAETAAKLTTDLGGPYGIGVRGSRSWASINSGFYSAYANFRENDFTVADGKLKAAMNSDGSRSFHQDWVKMIQQSGPKQWSNYTWYEVGNDIASGASAMVYDADILGYFMNSSDSRETGNLAFAPFAADPSAAAPTPNVWIWSLAMNTACAQKDAAWYFMQWAGSVEHALFGARKKDFVNPVRASVWKDEEFRGRINNNHPGYLNQNEVSAPGARIHFTAQPQFFDLITLWSEYLQKMVANKMPVDEALDDMAAEMDKKLVEAGLG